MRHRCAAALLAPALLLAVGCSGDDGSGTTPSPGRTASASASGSAAAVELPADFPREDVPLVEGRIGEVLVNDSLGSYLVKVYVDDFAESFAEARRQLEAAGFRRGKDVISAGPSSSTADFSSAAWFVIVTGGLPDRPMLQYTVYPAEG